MTEATTPSAQTQPATTTTEQPTPTLEEVYKEFNVSLPAASSQQQSVQTRTDATTVQAPPPLEVPDPIQDPEKFKAFMGERSKVESALFTSYQQVAGLLTGFQREQATQKLEKDISSAVETVNQAIGLPDPQKKLIEFALEDKARHDPRFKQIWDNRTQNPIAWSRALQAFSSEVGDTFSVKVDPQLRADRAALKLSQTQSATTKTETSEQPAWMSKDANDPEFQRNWQAMARGHQ